MKRRALVGISAITVLLLVTALFSLRHFRLAVLTHNELASRHITPPPLWADDCSKKRRTIADSREVPARTTTPLSADEIAIYRAVLQRWNSNAWTLLNVSNRTFPIDGTRDVSVCQCLNGIEVQSLVDASHSFHNLTRDVLPGKNMRLVNSSRQAIIVQANDPSNWIGTGKSVSDAVTDAFVTGLFSVSEIAFDTEHRRAIVAFSFVCGPRCGSGAALLFEKIGGEWKISDRTCGGWVS